MKRGSQVKSRKKMKSETSGTPMTSRESALGQAEKLDIDTIIHNLKVVQGKVLTVIEASISDKVQLKAVKDLINTSFSNQMQWIYQLCYPKTRMLTSDEAVSTIADLPE